MRVILVLFKEKSANHFQQHQKIKMPTNSDEEDDDNDDDGADDDDDDDERVEDHTSNFNA